MKPSQPLYLFAILLISFLGLVHVSLAQTGTLNDPNQTTNNTQAVTAQGLVPAGTKNYDPSGYGPCEFVTLVNNIIHFLVIMGSIFGMMVFLYAGFQLVASQGNPSALKKAKELFANVIIGFVIMLTAFLLVNTILSALLGNSPVLNWSTIQCTYENQVGVATTYGQTLQVSMVEVQNYQPESDGSTALVPSGSMGASCTDPSGTMVSIPGTSYTDLPDVVSDFVRMRDAAARAGITLTVTSGYRSDATQAAIWDSHNCNMNDCSGTVARPCSLGGNGSNHSTGEAIDIGNASTGSATYNWLRQNAGTYGFYNNLPQDPVHWSRSGN